MSDLDTGEALRRVENLIRVGTVHSVDLGAARMRVESGDLVTDWLPWLTARAGSDRTWWAPSVGEQVLLLSPGGLLEDAVVLPALYQDAHPAPSASASQHVTVYADGTTVTHDSAAHTLTINATGAINLIASGGLHISADVDIAGAMTISGGITSGGSITDADGDGGA